MKEAVLGVAGKPIRERTRLSPYTIPIEMIENSKISKPFNAADAKFLGEIPSLLMILLRQKEQVDPSFCALQRKQAVCLGANIHHKG